MDLWILLSLVGEVMHDVTLYMHSARDYYTSSILASSRLRGVMGAWEPASHLWSVEPVGVVCAEPMTLPTFFFRSMFHSELLTNHDNEFFISIEISLLHYMHTIHARIIHRDKRITYVHAQNKLQAQHLRKDHLGTSFG